MKSRILFISLIAIVIFYACKKNQELKVKYSTNLVEKKVQENVMSYDKIPIESRIKVANSFVFLNGKIRGSKEIASIFDALSKDKQLDLFKIILNNENFIYLDDKTGKVLLQNNGSTNWAPCGYYIILRNYIATSGDDEHPNCQPCSGCTCFTWKKQSCQQ